MAKNPPFFSVFSLSLSLLLAPSFSLPASLSLSLFLLHSHFPPFLISLSYSPSPPFTLSLFSLPLFHCFLSHSNKVLAKNTRFFLCFFLLSLCHSLFQLHSHFPSLSLFLSHSHFPLTLAFPISLSLFPLSLFLFPTTFYPTVINLWLKIPTFLILPLPPFFLSHCNIVFWYFCK